MTKAAKKKAAAKKLPGKRKTPRIATTERVPRTRAGNMWTEASFWSFIRSGLRRMSGRWPPLVRLALVAARRPYVGTNKLQKWVYQCRQCQQWFKRTQVEVDHIEPCGQLKSFADMSGFAERLFCECAGLRVVCNNCHLLITNAEKPELPPGSEVALRLLTAARARTIEGNQPVELEREEHEKEEAKKAKTATPGFVRLLWQAS